jgi:hypothetical protein
MEIPYLGVRHIHVAAVTRDMDVLRAERAADSVLRVRRGIQRAVQEPGAVVVPQVVVLVFRLETGGELGGGGHDA